MPVPLIYHEDYSPQFPAEHRFPMDKFRLLHDHLIDTGLTRDADLLRPELCPVDILALAHDRAYIERYMAGEIDVEPFISHHITLDEVNRGFELMEAQDGIRSVIELG